MRSTFRLGMGEWWAFSSAVTYALGNVLTRVVSVGGDALAGSILRTLPVMVVSAIAMAWRRGGVAALLPNRPAFVGWRGIRILALYSLVVTPAGILALYLAFRYGGVLVAVPVFSVNPLWGALIAVPFLGEAFNLRIAGGILATMVGIGLLTYGQHIGVPASEQWPLGVAYALITSLSWALGANFRRYLLSRGLDVFWLLGLTTGIGLAVLLMFLGFSGRLGALGEFTLAQHMQLLAAGGLSGIGNITITLAFVLTTVASVTTIKSLDVSIASVIAILFLGETLNLPVGAGILLIIVGVLIVQLGKTEPLPVMT